MKKLSKEEIEEISRSKIGATALSKKYGVSRRHIYTIWQRSIRDKIIEQPFTCNKSLEGPRQIIAVTLTLKSLQYLSRFPSRSDAINQILERMADIEENRSKKQ